jgi:hypothetical protein
MGEGDRVLRDRVRAALRDSAPMPSIGPVLFALYYWRSSFRCFFAFIMRQFPKQLIHNVVSQVLVCDPLLGTEAF